MSDRTEAKERPILFSAPMVRAILEGRKTQTRRVVKLNLSGRVEYKGKNWHLDDPNAVLACPYGLPGDRLWVRETWDFRDSDEGKVTVAYGADGDQRELCPPPAFNPVIYRPERWRPSIHMPRWASRILLEVEGVRVERLNAISETDAISEGVLTVRTPEWDLKNFPAWRAAFDKALAAGEKPPLGPTPAESFARLWDSINAKKYPWSSNPWVWVPEFKRVGP